MKAPASAPRDTSRQDRRPRGATALLQAFLAWLVLVPATGALAQLLIVDSEGTPVPGAVVFSAAGPVPATTFEPGPSRTPRAGVSADAEVPVDNGTPLVVDQRNKRFEPLVTVAPPGSLIDFPNSDDIRHHVYSFSEGNAFELKLYRSNEADPVRFAKAGVAALGCNIHDNMQAYVLVTDRSVTGVSDEAGIVAGWMSPSGAEVELWHPGLNVLGESRRFAVDYSTSPATVTLPIVWEDPQAARSQGELEALLKRFSDASS